MTDIADKFIELAERIGEMGSDLRAVVGALGENTMVVKELTTSMTGMTARVEALERERQVRESFQAARRERATYWFRTLVALFITGSTMLAVAWYQRLPVTPPHH